MNKKPLRVGFDLDGVLLYNPTRIARPLISFLKKKILHLNTNKTDFYFPKKPLERKIWIPIWKFFHLSSMFIAPGYEEIKKLAKEGKIMPVIISARYSFLEDNFNKWLKKLQAKEHFFESYMNRDDVQPHLFKEKMIKRLQLDYFVEDNLDIVRHIAENTSTKPIWIYNIFDHHIEFPHKVPTLKKAVEKIKEELTK